MATGGQRQIRMDDAIVDTATVRVAEAIDVIENSLDELERQSHHLRWLWSGDAAQAYDDAHRRWDRSLREMHAVARQLNAIAARGSQRFRSLDDANARVWAR